MYDRGKIISGLAVFFALATLPFWVSGGKSVPPPEIKTDTSVIRQLKVKRCLEPTSFMKVRHMELIISWRQAVVRDGQRIYVASDGRQYRMSLSGTCLNCHSNKSKFCDSCHTYAGVKPACWSCHIIPGEAEG